MDSTLTGQLLSDDQIAFYRENGFVQVDNVLREDEIAELRTYMNELFAVEDDLRGQNGKKDSAYYKVLNQKVNTWRDHGGMWKFSFHPTLAQLALRLSGSSGIRFFHDHALWKMPGDSKPTPWHQDLPYWPMNEQGALSIWIAIDDVNEQNGCMKFVPRSHKAGKLTAIDLVNPQDINDFIKGTPLAQQKSVIVPMKAGSCTFHNGLTFHYAHANMTDKPRRALAIIYMPDGTTFNGKGHVCTDGLGFAEGAPLSGRMFPKLA